MGATIQSSHSSTSILSVRNCYPLSPPQTGSIRGEVYQHHLVGIGSVFVSAYTLLHRGSRLFPDATLCLDWIPLSFALTARSFRQQSNRCLWWCRRRRMPIARYLRPFFSALSSLAYMESSNIASQGELPKSHPIRHATTDPVSDHSYLYFL